MSWQRFKEALRDGCSPEISDSISKCWKGGGGGGTQTTIQKSDPWAGQQTYLTDVFGKAQGWYGQPGPTMFPDQTYASQDPLQTASREMTLNYAGSPELSGGIGSALGAQQYATSGVMNNNPSLAFWGGGLPQAAGTYSNVMNRPYESGISDPTGGLGVVNPNQALMQQMSGAPNNPFLQQTVQNTLGDMASVFNEQVMPGLRHGAIGAGQLGGSRQGVGEGIASERLLRQMGNVGSQMYSGAYENAQNRALQATGMGLQNVLGRGQLNLGAQQAAEAAQQGRAGQALGAAGQVGGGYTGAFNQALEQQAKGLALAPQTLGLGLMPANLAAGVGGQRQALDQQALDEQIARHSYEQNLPLAKLQDYSNLIQGQYGGTSTTQTPYDRGNNLLGGLGSALSIGSGLGLFGGGMGAVSGLGGYATLPSAGGILGLTSVFCSKDWKEDYTEIDHDKVLEGVDQINVEAWRYKGSANRHIGPYAEEFNEMFGLDGGKMIDAVDVIGILLSSVKALSAKVKELEAK